MGGGVRACDGGGVQLAVNANGSYQANSTQVSHST